jgi:Effector-associated domain 11
MDRKKIEKLIAEGKPDKAIEELMRITERFGGDNHNTILSLSSQLQDTNRSYRLGEIGRHDYDSSRSRITRAILEFLNDIEPKQDKAPEQITKVVIKNVSQEKPNEVKPTLQKKSPNQGGCIESLGFLLIIGLAIFFMSKGCNRFTKTKPDDKAIAIADRIKGEKIITAYYCNIETTKDCPIIDYYVVNFESNIINDTTIIIKGKGIHSARKDRRDTTFEEHGDENYYWTMTDLDVINASVTFTVSSKKENSWTMTFNNWPDGDKVNGYFKTDGFNHTQLSLQSRIKTIKSTTNMRAGDNINTEIVGQLKEDETYELYAFGKDEAINSKKGYWRYIKVEQDSIEKCWIWIPY